MSHYEAADADSPIKNQHDVVDMSRDVYNFVILTAANKKNKADAFF